jgi:hypothetical protein
VLEFLISPYIPASSRPTPRLLIPLLSSIIMYCQVELITECAMADSHIALNALRQRLRTCADLVGARSCFMTRSMPTWLALPKQRCSRIHQSRCALCKLCVNVLEPRPGKRHQDLLPMHSGSPPSTMWHIGITRPEHQVASRSRFPRATMGLYAVFHN